LLIVFLGLAGLFVERLFSQQAEAALRNLLDAQMVALIAATEVSVDGAILTASGTTEPRLQTPGSGLYASIYSLQGQPLWRSESLVGTFVDLTARLRSGEVQYADRKTPAGEPLAAVWRGIAWQFAPGREQQLVFAMAATRAPALAAQKSLRRNLIVGSLAFAGLLFGALLWVLRGATRPLRQLEEEIAAVEAGERQNLSEGFPREVAGVAAGLNTLLTGERKRIARHRNNLADLAHSLKTPLAVIRASLDGGQGLITDASATGVISGEVDKMTSLIDRQLKRAAMSGGVTLGQAPIELAPVLAELRVTLLRAYAHKDLTIELQVSSAATFRGDRTDLLEMVGNLLDNACKWCASRVSARVQGDAQMLHIDIEDDGPGMPASLVASGPSRGLRADEATPGHGFGLAMVRDIAESYGGELTLGTSQLGGALASLRLPRPAIDAPPRPLPLLGGVRRR
jgi:two-component system sensor histidine kinase PhoQ